MTQQAAQAFSSLTSLPLDAIQNIDILGGMTNVNYKISLTDGRQFVLRMPGKASNDIICREDEFKNNVLAHELGVANEIVAFDAVSGLKLTTYIPQAETLTPLSLARHSKTIASHLSRLHNSSLTLADEFSITDEYNKYRKIVADRQIEWSHVYNAIDVRFDGLNARLSELKGGGNPCACHNDPVPENFVLSHATTPPTLYLIDWEYAGQNDPMWDLAAVIEEAGLDSAHEAVFIEAYLELNPELCLAVVKEKILIFRIFQNMLWYLWTLIKEAQGDDFGGYGTKRHDAAIRLIAQYDATYGVEKA